MSKYIDGSRIVYWNDSNGNLTVPGTLSASNIVGASFSLGPVVQFSSIVCSSINAATILNGSNTSFLSYTNSNAPASDGTVSGINITALNQRARASLGEQLLFTSSMSWTTWTARPVFANLGWRKIAWSPTLKLYCAVSGSSDRLNNIMTSPDGIRWTLRTTLSLVSFGGIIWADTIGRFVAITGSTSQSYSAVSSDGITWTLYSLPTNGTWNELTWSSQLSLMVAVSTSPLRSLAYSSDGQTWITLNPYSLAQTRWNSVCWAAEAGLFVAVGSFADAGVNQCVMTSPNGITWTQRTAPATKDWYSIAWSPELKLFAAVSRTGDTSGIMTSPDGVSWTLRTTPAIAFTCIIWIPEMSMFVVSNDSTNASVTVSRDGITWISHLVLPLTRSYYGMVWSREQSKLVLVDNSIVGGSGGTGLVVTSEVALPASQNTLLFTSPGHASVNNSTGLISMSSMNISSATIGFLSGSIRVAALSTTNISSAVTTVSTINANTISSATAAINSVNATAISSAVTTASTINANTISSATAAINSVNATTISSAVTTASTINANTISSATAAINSVNATTISSAVTTASTINVNTISSASVATNTIQLANAKIILGSNAGEINSGASVVALGYLAGNSTQGAYSIAIGQSAGQITQNAYTVAVGLESGYSNQGANAISMGVLSGSFAQGSYGISIGASAGYDSQESYGIAIGNQAGRTNQRAHATAVGNTAGSTNQGSNAVAIGNAAGNSNQGSNAIAIGKYAGQTNQIANSIIINASDSALNATTNAGFYVNPVRNATTANVVYYDTTTKELTYDVAGGPAVVSTFNSFSTGTASIGALNVSSIGGFSPIKFLDAIIANSTIIASTVTTSSITTNLVTTSSITTNTFNTSSITLSDSVNSITSQMNYNTSYSGWTARGSPQNWINIASSADGTKLAAVVYNGQIYTSTDSGVSWTARDSPRNWYDVAMSADGVKLVAAVVNGNIYTSTDSGATWAARESPRFWRSVASSADGSKLVAVVNGGQIYTSPDSGATWSARDSPRSWYGVASSADGSKLVAVDGGGRGGQIYTSTDSGASWTARESNRNWSCVASSADGTKLVAAEKPEIGGGQIYTSSDSGLTWTARESNRNWECVASSADGSKLVAVALGGQIYTSSDYGFSWTARETSRNWVSVASSADGSKLAALVLGGQIYTTTLTGDININPLTNLKTSGYNVSRFIGKFTAPPQGEYGTLYEGDFYYHTTSSALYCYVSSAWSNATLPVSSFTSFSTGTASIGALNVSSIGGFSPIQFRDAIITNSTIIASSIVTSVFNAPSVTLNDSVNSTTSQMTYTGSFSGWAARDAERNWKSIASSADGTRLVAVVLGGQIYTSSDTGVSWTARESNRDWYAVASSADGKKLVAVGLDDRIYTSTDFGVSWTPRESNQRWSSVASSANGTKLVAAGFNGNIYTSTDSGVSWTARDSSRAWIAVASSADGVKLVAAVNNGQIYTSTNSGLSWTARESTRNWALVASSADGAKLLAAVSGGQLYTSTDSGLTWTPRASNRNWECVASSADGIKLAAVVFGFIDSYVYTSTDGGITWYARTTSFPWKCIACSADGSKLVAGTNAGQLFVASFTGNINLNPLTNFTAGVLTVPAATGPVTINTTAFYGTLQLQAEYGPTENGIFIKDPGQSGNNGWLIGNSVNYTSVVSTLVFGRITGNTSLTTSSMCVTSDGWLGLGTFSPSQKLTVIGNASITGSLSKGSGTFKIDHPLPSKTDTHYLVHSFIEGPKADLIYRGKVQLVNGKATVNIDQVAGMTEGTFEVLCRDVQCFTTNESDWNLVRGQVSGNVLTIEAQDIGATSLVSWMVIGERKDKHMYDTEWTDDNGRVIVEPPKSESESESE
jgi:hypothetical protein